MPPWRLQTSSSAVQVSVSKTNLIIFKALPSKNEVNIVVFQAAPSFVIFGENHPSIFVTVIVSEQSFKKVPQAVRPARERTLSRTPAVQTPRHNFSCPPFIFASCHATCPSEFSTVDLFNPVWHTVLSHHVFAFVSRTDHPIDPFLEFALPQSVP